ncbi:phosphatase [Psychromonas sp. MB-3u-54]|uniref:HAD family hydrolase n=1 Tax=Psychromonas sp. MB-3u-54 TaxID=2058319 RepID=UPI000C32E38F|nr:HAD family phosphatase [Psychromonas sp. MB-3u-54]PKH04567.1 phosphatase [Psychromonas sp. MB-3u-54]
MNYQAAVFDMDGLLLDTERVCQQAFQDACRHLSLPILNETYLKIIGTNALSIKNIITAGYGPELDYERLRIEWMKRYHAVVNFQAIPVKEGVIALLDWLWEQSIPMAVATSSEKEVALTKLKLSGLAGYFQQLSTGCEVTHSKPHPEIFLLAAQRLNTDPTACLAFEDSNHGVRAAVSAGMQVFQVPDLVTPCAETLALGHQVKPSLSDVLSRLKNAQQENQ